MTLTAINEAALDVAFKEAGTEKCKQESTREGDEVHFAVVWFYHLRLSFGPVDGDTKRAELQQLSLKTTTLSLPCNWTSVLSCSVKHE